MDETPEERQELRDRVRTLEEIVQRMAWPGFQNTVKTYKEIVQAIKTRAHSDET